MAQERLYTVKEVSQLTGIPPATLRKWEQRYQVVSPARLPNGYRGYTAQDLKVLRRVNALVQDGTPVSLAVEAARRPDAPQPVADTVEMNQGARYRDALLRSLTAVDETGARRVMDEAFAVLQVEQVLRSVLEPVLREIGQLWAAGTISEYQEHFASVLIRDRLSALRALLPPGVGPHLITACLPGELHEIGTLIVTILALRRGFQVTHLSGSPSPEGLKRAVRELRPDAVLLSVTMLDRLTAGLEFLRSLAAVAAGGPRILVGGQAVQTSPSLPAIAGVTFTKEDAGTVLDELKHPR